MLEAAIKCFTLTYTSLVFGVLMLRSIVIVTNTKLVSVCVKHLLAASNIGDAQKCFID